MSSSTLNRRGFTLAALALLLYLSLAGIARAALRPEVDARALGMGGAWIALAEGSSAIFWNPARLTTAIHPQLFYDLSQGAFAASLPLPPLGVIGVSAVDLHSGDDLFIDSPNNPVGRFELGYNQVALSYARPVTRNLLIGGSMGSSRSPQQGSRWQAHYDLGVSWRMTPSFTVGARMTDISNTRITDQDGRLLEEFPQALGVGTAWRWSRWGRITTGLDTARWRLRLGGEIYWRWLSLRAGVFADLNEPREPFHWSSGASIRRRRFELSYAYVDVEERYHRLSINWYFGQSQRRSYTEHEVIWPVPEAPEGKPPGQRPSRWDAPPSPKYPLKPPTHSPQPPRSSPPIRIEPPETLLRVEPLPNPGDSSASSQQDKAPQIEKLASQYRIEIPLILAVVRAESGFDPDIVSRAGAVGLTQLMPDTARSLGLKVPHYSNIKQPIRDPKQDERFHPRKNLIAGLAYLRALLDSYEDNIVLAVSAYNAGPGRVTEQVPGIRETERHVARVMNYYYQYRASPAQRQADMQRLEQVLQSVR